MQKKLLLIILDGLPWRNARTLMGNLEGWVESNEAHVWRMRAVLPSTSASCYASIHTGVTPQVHGVTGNNTVFKLKQADIFSAVSAAGGKSAAVTHSFWSEFFQRSPFDAVRDIEYDEKDGPIHHGRFHTMAGYGSRNQMTPSDEDLFATLTNLCQRFDVNYGILHTCTLDSMGHRYGHDCTEMDSACFTIDEQLAPFIRRWRKLGYQVIVTADHGQTDRGHHGGNSDLMRDVALYYFGDANPVSTDTPLSQLQLAPTILKLLDVAAPDSMKAPAFLEH